MHVNIKIFFSLWRNAHSSVKLILHILRLLFEVRLSFIGSIQENYIALKQINFKVRAVEFDFSHLKYILKSQKNHLKRGELKPTGAFSYFAKNVSSVYCAHHVPLSSDAEA